MTFFPFPGQGKVSDFPVASSSCVYKLSSHSPSSSTSFPSHCFDSFPSNLTKYLLGAGGGAELVEVLLDMIIDGWKYQSGIEISMSARLYVCTLIMRKQLTSFCWSSSSFEDAGMWKATFFSWSSSFEDVLDFRRASQINPTRVHDALHSCGLVCTDWSASKRERSKHTNTITHRVARTLVTWCRDRLAHRARMHAHMTVDSHTHDMRLRILTSRMSCDRKLRELSPPYRNLFATFFFATFHIWSRCVLHVVCTIIGQLRLFYQQLWSLYCYITIYI